MISPYVYVGLKQQSETVMEIVCGFFGVTEDELKSTSRKQPLVYARQVYCFIMVKFCEMGTSIIGRHIRKDHSTVTNSVKAIYNMAQTDSDFYEKLKHVCTLVSYGFGTNLDSIITDRIVRVDANLANAIDGSNSAHIAARKAGVSVATIRRAKRNIQAYKSTHLSRPIYEDKYSGAF